ncbi:hypothetical protein J7400_17905 [Shimia sp. R9_2]|uniref:hypothetical protein n=1 Tax=Shimia sp. R9_2 TaxID=2821112 RepID=UPI001ADA7D88|nr:hypothetical protein [Shimia sp. R9_2]MBO9398551.1 hypothetical protein [Shimia sp. R9_2]
MLDNDPFTTFEPGQIISAAAMNAMQSKMRAEIHKQIAEALAALTEVDLSKDSNALEGHSAQDLLSKFLEQAMQKFPGHTGYRKLFKVLEFNEPNLIEHELKLCPLVDLYELQSFDVICADDDDKRKVEARFFLYHTSEKKISMEGPNGTETVEIEKRGETPFSIPVSEMLDYLGVEYIDETSLGDLETELWKAMFAPPNDPFDPSDYCHSPWYERCCREERTVGSLKAKGDWDDLKLKMQPVKTVNTPSLERDTTSTNRHPPEILVEHHDFDRLSLKLRERIPIGNGDDLANVCLMVLLKV